MKTLVLSIGMSILGMLPLSAQLSITTSVTPSCPPPNCNGLIYADAGIVPHHQLHGL